MTYEHLQAMYWSARKFIAAEHAQGNPNSDITEKAEALCSLVAKEAYKRGFAPLHDGGRKQGHAKKK